MKKSIVSILTIFLLLFSLKSFSQTSNSPIYKTAAGLTVEFGTGGAIVGPAIKHYFDIHNALQGELMFGDGATYFSSFYTFNGSIKNASGLNYNVGFGPALCFVSGSQLEGTSGQTLLFLRPTAGLDYKISETPLNLTFDWRPSFYVGNGSKFIPARFGIGLRFAF